jgi:hypothetical protein
MMKRIKKILLWLLCAMGVSTILGIADCWIAGTSHRGTAFSVPVWKLSDGGTSGYIGFGYSLTYYRKMGGEHGSEIWYWFTPFSVYHTTERTGIRWLFASGTKEPTYQGRTLSQWISVYFSGYSGDSPHATLEEGEAAEQAIRAMGTNTFSTLIAWLSEDRPSIGKRSTALQVFQILGEQGKPAAPVLIELTKNPDKEIRYYALDCLLAVKPEKEVLAPTLVPLVHDPDKNIGFIAAENLVDLDVDAAEKAGVFDVFPQFNSLLETNKIENK